MWIEGRRLLAFTDAHLDIAWASLTHGRDFVAGHPDAALGLPDLLRGGVTLACATVFSAKHEEEETPEEVAEHQLAYYDALPGRSGGKVIWPADVMDVGSCVAGERVCLVGLLEGCEPVREVTDLASFYRRGLRVVGLTWNRRNRWAGGCDGGGGLTAEGASLVQEADRLGMVHDVAHLSRAGVDDLLATARGPVIASHVGADAVYRHVRNLTDEHMKAIAQRGGVVALVLYEKFLADGKATFDDAMRHLRHMIEVCGVDGVGIGSDMDGGFGRDALPTGIRTAADLPKFAGALRQDGLSEPDAAKICGGNLRRLLTAMM
ncbi:MAG: dipeptidase [Planctomycetota bacterium]